MKTRKVLLIYTGGTIGMKKDYDSDSLKPFDFEHIVNEVPELSKIGCTLDVYSFEKPIDSSDMSPTIWKRLVELIEEKYDAYHGFVILHGSDTMAYSASALSFMLENLDKPVIFTGSQLPIGTLRTDGKENLITAIEIAASYKGDRPRVPEVAIYFEYSLYRGNRARKVDAEHFKAFETLNYPLLASAGVSIAFNDSVISNGHPNSKLETFKEIDPNITIIKLFPGIQGSFVKSVCETPNLHGIILESFGSGNSPDDPVLLKALDQAISSGIVVLNISQCHGGSVHQGKYQNSKILDKIGVITGNDMTTEAALAKMMYLLGKYSDKNYVSNELVKSLRGEMTNLRKIKE